jgi:hypothetical protein
MSLSAFSYLNFNPTAPLAVRPSALSHASPPLYLEIRRNHFCQLG